MLGVLKLKKHQECTNKFSWPFHLCTRECTVRGAGRWPRGLGLLPRSLMDRLPPVSAVFPWHQMTRLITATATLTKTCQYFMSCQNKGLNCVWICKVKILQFCNYSATFSFLVIFMYNVYIYIIKKKLISTPRVVSTSSYTFIYLYIIYIKLYVQYIYIHIYSEKKRPSHPRSWFLLQTTY